MLGIIILNYNTWNETIKCIYTIERYITIDYHIYAIDNCSSVKATPEQENQIRNKAELIYNDRNTGYAAGNNIGLKKAYEDGCDQFMICNSDILFNDNSIAVISEFASSREDIGIVGPQLYNTDGLFQRINMLSKLTALGKIKNMLLNTPLKGCFKNFEKGFIRKTPITKPLRVFGVSGCCFLITKRGFEKCFPFDEHTFLYEEEYILGCRLEEKKLKAYVVPNTHVIHAHGKSTGGMTEFSYKCLVDSEQYYLKEYLKTGILLRLVIKLIRKIVWFIRYNKG